MRQLRQTLRLHLEAGLSLRECARVLDIGKTTVNDIVRNARAAGVDWTVAQSLSDEELEARLYRPAVPRSARHLEPDYAHIHQELKRPGVTLQLLWEEYAQANEQAYKYTSFCIKYRDWAASLKRSMRQVHVGGEKLFADYAGQTIPIVDAATGEIRAAQVFVATLGASNYTYACATATQTAADWVGSLIGALEFIGGLPRLIVPDQPRALIAQPDRYEPGLGRLVQEFCDHYSVAVLPARPAHPRDKPKVECAVLVVERWVLARLRNRRFFSLGELNAAIAELVTDLNARAFKKLPGCRREAFERLDRPALRALPPTRMPIVRFKRARVNIFCGLPISVAMVSRSGLRRRAIPAA
jgi:transposase